MIVNASVRTDIPAFYASWFVHRLQEGYALVKNPYNEHQVSYIDVSNTAVDAIVFCTKDPSPMIPYLDRLDAMGYVYCFMVTITPYGKEIEKNVPHKEVVIDAFISMSKRIGKKKMIWRYDPIFINEVYTIERHCKEFSILCQQLATYTDTVIISFIDIYNNIKGKYKEPTMLEMKIISETFVKIASNYSITVQACAEKYDLVSYGIQQRPCLNQEWLQEVIGYPIEVKAMNNRKHCHCLESIEIGAYDTCLHGCTYCYACKNHDDVLMNYKKHNPKGALLLGELSPLDSITKRKVASNKVRQLKFDL